MTTETRTFPGLLEVRAGGDGRTVTGLVAPFYAPTAIGSRFTEMFEPGSFRLDEPVRLHPGHPETSRDLPVSPPGRLWEQRNGVVGEWHLTPGNTNADNLLASIHDNAVTGLSVGFHPDEAADRWSGDVVTRRGARLIHVAAVETPAYHGAQITSVRAELSAAEQNDLPDSAFAYIEPGGTKDDTGRTTPRSLRHFPVHDAAHARNALARLSQSPFGEKARPKVEAAARKFGIDVSDAEPGGGRSQAGGLAELRAELAAMQAQIGAALARLDTLAAVPRAAVPALEGRSAEQRMVEGALRPDGVRTPLLLELELRLTDPTRPAPLSGDELADFRRESAAKSARADLYRQQKDPRNPPALLRSRLEDLRSELGADQPSFASAAGVTADLLGGTTPRH